MRCSFTAQSLRQEFGIGRCRTPPDAQPVKIVPMSKSNALLDTAAVSRIIEMAWEDRTPFEAIHAQFALGEDAVSALMRQQLNRGSYRLWLERVRGRKTKHAALRPTEMAGGQRHQARHRLPQR